VLVQAYRFASNEYRLFDFCAAMITNDFGLRGLTKCGNLTLCPFKKGKRVVCNFTPDGNRFPPLIPAGSYKVDSVICKGEAEVLALELYAKISYPLV
ncbi:hypothetical protein ILUMI_14204, partial [Ignelater luminosus]